MKYETPIASVHIHRAWDMTPTQRKEIAVWLREQAKEILKEGKDYATRFTAAFYWDFKSSGARKIAK